MFMWLNPNARLFSADDSTGYLVQVVLCFHEQNQLKVHLLNTYGSKKTANGRRTGWELLWGDGGDFEKKERRTPVTHKYKPSFVPWLEDVNFEDLVPAAIKVTGGPALQPASSGQQPSKPKRYSIPQSFWDQYVVRAAPPTWSEHAAMLDSRKARARS